MVIKSLILGAGQEVGKSCVVVTLGGKTIMFDCGMHMGYNDDRRYPDFSLISKSGNYTESIDCVIITHFHLDHVGALPYFTEVCGYEGPIFMTYPTKALAPLMLEDYRKVMVERRGEQEQFSVLQIHECMKKVTAVDLRQTVNVGVDFQLRPYYAGHVLGAAMFYVKVGDSSVVYTGDYNMTPDRHLGAAQIDRLQPDLVITESTYATTIRDSKNARERDFLKAVHTCITAGGKVLIPVFALGRAQELCILLDDYWERMNLKAPIYFSAGLTMQANVYYKLLISWTSQKVKDTCVNRNTFDFKHVSPFERSQIDAPGPCVLFASPGMLTGGLSLEVFKHWAPFEQNMVVVPGYCVPGTVGHKLMSGKPTRIDIDKRTQLDVRCQIHHLSFSAHTDAKGIMDLLRHVGPRHVILVHGERPKMALLKTRVTSELGIPCFDPANSDVIEVPSCMVVKVQATEIFLTGSPILAESRTAKSKCSLNLKGSIYENVPAVMDNIHTGVVMMDQRRNIQVMNPSEALATLGVPQHKLTFKCYCPVYIDSNQGVTLAGKALGALEWQDNSSQGGSNIAKESGPIKKKYRMDFQRSLSLDLEREPTIDDTEEMHHESDCKDGVLSESYSSVASIGVTTRINVSKSLDMNEIPDDNRESSSESLTLLSNAASILHAVYMWLVQWLGRNTLEELEDCIMGRSLCIRICTDRTFQETLTEKKTAAMLECSWASEDEKLANRAISLISTLRLRSG